MASLTPPSPRSPLPPQAPGQIGAGSPLTDAPGKAFVYRCGTLTYTFPALCVLFFWLLWGDFAWNIKDRSINDVMKLMLKEHGAGDFLVGMLILTIPTALTLLIAPVVSYKSDRYRSKWGRRIPFLLVPTPIAAVSIALLAFSPHIGEVVHASLGPASPGLTAVTLGLMGLIWGVFEAATIIVNTLLGALINDVVPQELLGRFYGMFRAVSVGCGILFNWYILGHADQWYFWIFLALAVVYGVGFTLMCLNVREGQYPPPPPVAERKPGDLAIPLLPPGMLSYLKECFSSRYYLLVFGTLAMVTAGLAPGGLFSLFFARSVNLSLETFGRLNATAFLASFLLAVPMGWVADRFHPVRVGFVLLVVVTGLNVLMSVLGTTATRFAAFHISLTIVCGCYYTATASINQRLFPRSKFAQYASALVVIVSLMNLWIGPVVGAILDRTGHDYRYAYTVSWMLLLVALGMWWAMWKQYNAHGGVRGYVAPGEGAPAEVVEAGRGG